MEESEERRGYSVQERFQPALPLCLFPHSNGLARADGERRPRPVSVWFRPFRDSLGPPLGCGKERVQVRECRDAAHPRHPTGGSLFRGPG